MTKSAMPMPKASGGAMPKLVSMLVAVAVLTLVVRQPAQSAEWATNAATGLGAVIDGIATFLEVLLG